VGCVRKSGADVSQSFTLVMEGTTHAEEPTVALAKALAPCFVLRGAQLAIVRRLEGTHVVHVHTALLTWLGKRLAAAEAAKNRSARNTAALFFRALTPLLVVALDARDALKMCGGVLS
jgi:cohesin complex subunit SA-1/2